MRGDGMRCLTRNKTSFSYATYVEPVEILDEYGNATGQYKVLYSNPIKTEGNISTSQGEMQSRQFGGTELYDKVIVFDKPAPPIDEYSILWIDRQPKVTQDGSLALTEDGEIETPHDYIVKKVASSLNSVAIAISKVTVK